ncbi:hypothetical protein [Streptomyces sp. NBC_00328]|uniref:hypothetical protein n=1 Tax=Streptomyces sp. NBC_00328 TaxID=2903646 RepID=UPI002E2BE8E0|nr:hypothetical protein [Streptomyces sp. NBC_00328]
MLLIIGIIMPVYVMTNLTGDRDKWREAFEKEREAHQLPLEQLATAEERATWPPSRGG